MSEVGTQLTRLSLQLLTLETKVNIYSLLSNLVKLKLFYRIFLSEFYPYSNLPHVLSSCFGTHCVVSYVWLRGGCECEYGDDDDNNNEDEDDDDMNADGKDITVE